MNSEQKGKIDQLLCYMASSARGLLDEPATYGPFRLIDSVSRLIEILEADGMADEALLEARERIEEDKFTVMSDVEQFKKMLDETVVALAARLTKD